MRPPPWTRPENLEIRRAAPGSPLPLPWRGHAAAGFPSPAQDHQEGVIDLNRELVAHPEATFCMTVRGESMVEAGLHDGDILVVDRSLSARRGQVAVCVLDGAFAVKTYEPEGDRIVLRSANPRFSPIVVEPGRDFEVWGVVTWILHRARCLP